MSKKIDGRLPREIGEGALPSHAAVKSPWEKLVSYHDAVHYCQRYTAVVGVAVMQAYRILIPDYVERSKILCKTAYDKLKAVYQIPGMPEAQSDELNTHPFCRGNYVGALFGDAGDETLMMCGRVNDFGTYRVEKELDACYWDIIGSELCRSTTQSFQATIDETAKIRRNGPMMELHMVEAKGCGDRHCRIVGECREKFPMPEHEQWECFGPIATEDQIKFTKEEDTVSESQIFREECNFTFANGTNCERPSTSAYPMCTMSNGSAIYLLPALEAAVQQGIIDAKFTDHVLKCVCEAAGKALFGEPYARDAQRQWVGAPRDIDDGRLMGAHLEMFLQCMRVPYEIEAFNQEEVIYVIDRMALANFAPRMVDSYVAFWSGAVRTLVNAQWFLWEEPGLAPAEKLRLKIAKKIDKFC